VSVRARGYESTTELIPSDTIFLNPSVLPLLSPSSLVGCWVLFSELSSLPFTIDIHGLAFLIDIYLWHRSFMFPFRFTSIKLLLPYGQVIRHPPVLRGPSSRAMFPAPNGLTSSEGSTLGPCGISRCAEGGPGQVLDELAYYPGSADSETARGRADSWWMEMGKQHEGNHVT